MVLLIVDNYKNLYPSLTGKSLTDRVVIELLKHYYPDIESSGIQIKRTENGKPYIVWGEGKAAPHISVSHCDGIFACAIDDDNVGIDIQNERDVAAEKIKSRYFTDAEQAEDFYKVWTRKEAYSKFTGRGLAQIIDGEEVLERQDVIFDDFVIPENIHVSVCRPSSKGSEDNYEVQFFDRKQDR